MCMVMVDGRIIGRRTFQFRHRTLNISIEPNLVTGGGRGVPYIQVVRPPDVVRLLEINFVHVLEVCS